jgi:serine/threonine-protein phosphatase PGAM5
MARRTLYLVRHGQYRLHQRDMGSLTHKGEAQSQLTAEALKSLPFSLIYYSPVLRATQTAEIIAAQLGDAKQIEHEALREDLTAEQVSDCAEKLDAAFRYYFRPSELEHDVYEMLVCHGNVIRYFVSRVLKLHSDGWSNMMINNCGISRVLVDHDGEMYLISHNDIGHLPEELRTDN